MVGRDPSGASFVAEKEFVDDNDVESNIFHEGDDALEPLAAPLRPVDAGDPFEAAQTARGAKI